MCKNGQFGEKISSALQLLHNGANFVAICFIFTHKTTLDWWESSILTLPYYQDSRSLPSLVTIPRESCDVGSVEAEGIPPTRLEFLQTYPGLGLGEAKSGERSELQSTNHLLKYEDIKYL